jgi:outer membrane biosynthesis protein TonB
VTAAARRNFDAQELTIASAVALLAQLVFVAVFSLPSPKLVQADISNANSQPIAVAITPVLKLGSKNPTKLPSQWQRKQPVAPKPTEPTALPSPQTQKTPEAIPTTHVPDAAAPLVPVEAGAPDQPSSTAPAGSGTVATAASTEGSEQGSASGTETDPLKGRAADMYRQQIAAWFISRFNIRGKIPFDKLKTLRAAAVVSVTSDRKVGSFSIVKPSGDPTFDAQVQATLAGAQSSGAELPAPPPMYPEFLAKSQSLMFECTVQKLCE